MKAIRRSRAFCRVSPYARACSLFRETALARGVGLVDAGLVFAVTGLALLANGISARIAGSQVSAVMSQFRAGFPAEESAPAGEGPGDIIEGEVLDRD